MKYLVTGGAGFIGSHICEELLAAGHEVRVLDNLSSGYERNIVGLDVEFVQADVRDAEAVSAAAEEVDGIFHDAALVSVPESVEKPLENDAINVTGTLNVLLAARQRGVRRAVLASSAAVYGNDPELPKREDMLPEPVSPYALGKVAGEYYMRVFAELYGVQTVSLRYFNVFGPRQDPSSMYSGVISKFVDVLGTGGTPTVFGDGEQTRDFVYVKDVVAANLLAMSSGRVGRGEVFNVGTGKRTSLLELIAALAAIFGREVRPTFADERAGDIRHSVSDISRARDLLGYEPRATLEEGLRALIVHSP
ncbi:MAG: NAD-dependent epimerase/dehydratase family protein [Planctomycetota bacterium]|jgi:UDP-glucose 4-epimerase